MKCFICNKAVSFGNNTVTLSKGTAHGECWDKRYSSDKPKRQPPVQPDVQNMPFDEIKRTLAFNTISWRVY